MTYVNILEIINLRGLLQGPPWSALFITKVLIGKVDYLACGFLFNYGKCDQQSIKNSF